MVPSFAKITTISCVMKASIHKYLLYLKTSFVFGCFDEIDDSGQSRKLFDPKFCSGDSKKISPELADDDDVMMVL